MIETAKKLLEGLKENDVQAFNIGKDKAPTGETVINIQIKLKRQDVPNMKPENDIETIRKQYKNY